MTPVARSLAYLRAQGYHAFVVERLKPRFACFLRTKGRQRTAFFLDTRIDFGGFADIIAYQAGYPILAVQTTTRDHDDRCMVLSAMPEVIDWQSAGGIVKIHGWAKVGARGKRKTWEVKVVVV